MGRGARTLERQMERRRAREGRARQALTERHPDVDFSRPQAEPQAPPAPFIPPISSRSRNSRSELRTSAMPVLFGFRNKLHNRLDKNPQLSNVVTQFPQRF